MKTASDISADTSSDLGVAGGTVVLREYRAAWPGLFEHERAAIAAALGSGALAIEHVGSTSVAGLAAKPIIDIAIGVESFEASIVLAAPLEALGYAHRGEFGIPRRRYFTKGEPRTHHIHMLEIASDEWRCHLHFREFLRAHPSVAAEYGSLKRELAERHASDREGYTEAKSEFIRSVLRRAAIEFAK